MTLLKILEPALKFQRLLGLISFKIYNNRIETPKYSIYLQLLPITLYTFCGFTLSFLYKNQIQNILNFETFVSTQFSATIVASILTHYAIHFASIFINDAQIEYFNKITHINSRLKEELDIKIDYNTLQKYLRRTMYIFIFNVVLNMLIVIYFDFEKDMSYMLYVLTFIIPDITVVSENVYYFMVTKIIADQVWALEQHFSGNVTERNVVKKFTSTMDIYFELCDLIRFQSDHFGFRVNFNLSKDVSILTFAIFAGFWMYSDTQSIEKTFPIIFATTLFWLKIISVIWICHFTTKSVSVWKYLP